MHHDELVKAIRMIGSQKKLAEQLGVTRFAINHWLNRDNTIPVEQALMIEVVTNGNVKSENLVHKAERQITAFKKYILLKEKNNGTISQS